MSRQQPSSPVSRRRFLQLGGAAGAAAFLGTALPAATLGAARPAVGPAARGHAQTGGSFRIATWIGYIDVDEYMAYPSLDRFTEETGITIDYQEAVEDNESFFASDLRGPIEAGVPTGWDIVVLTDWMVQRLVNLGWLEEIDTAATPSYPANLAEVYRTRAWDPENRFAAPWFSGMTGIGHDAAVTGPLTSVSAFYDPQWSGRISYLSEMNDCVGLTALSQGADPSVLTQEQFDAALAKIGESIDAGIVRRMTGNSYVEDMATGDVVVAMAWSGDVLSLLIPDQREDQDIRWTFPDEGAMLWTDNMCIPKGAENKAAAETFIDWYYRPENAGPIDAYVQYVSPVVGAGEVVAGIDPALVENTAIFPTDEMRSRLRAFVSVAPDLRAEWEAAFASTIGL